MYERKRKSPGEIVFVQCPTEKNLLYTFSSKRPCFPTAPHLTNDGNYSSNQRVDRVNLSSYSISPSQTHIVMDTSTTGYFPYEDVNYQPRICRMCAAGDSGHINHILS